MADTDHPHITITGDISSQRIKPTVTVAVRIGPLAVLFEAVMRRRGAIMLRAPHIAGGAPGATLDPELEAEVKEAVRRYLARPPA